MPDESVTIGDPVGPWVVVRALGDDAWLGEDQGQEVVIKRLDASCVRGDKLRDGVRERLHRIRQLPHVSMANLLGVEKTAAGVWCVWEHVPGEPLEQWMRQVDEAEQIRMSREVVLAVMGMHALGIVHGAIHERNVIVSGRQLRLTHASALMWNDESRDADAVMQMLRRCAGERSAACEPMGGDALSSTVAAMQSFARQASGINASTRLSRWVEQAQQEQWSLSDFARRLMSVDAGSVDESDADSSAAEDRWIRLRAGVMLIGVIALGGVISLGLWQWSASADLPMGTGAGELHNINKLELDNAANQRPMGRDENDIGGTDEMPGANGLQATGGTSREGGSVGTGESRVGEDASGGDVMPSDSGASGRTAGQEGTR